MSIWKSLKNWFDPPVESVVVAKPTPKPKPKSKPKKKPAPPAKKPKPKPKAPSKKVQKAVETVTEIPPLAVEEIKVDGKHVVKKPKKSKASVDKPAESATVVEIKDGDN